MATDTKDMRVGFTFDEATRLAVDQGGAQKTRSDELLERIGNTFLNKILQKVAESSVDGAVTQQTDAITQAKAAVELIRELRSLDGGARRKIKLASLRPKSGAGDAAMTKMFTELIGKIVDMVGETRKDLAEMVRDSEQRTREMIKEIVKDNNSGKADNRLEQVLWSMLEQRLNSDPLREYLQLREHFRQELGSGEEDLEKYLTKRKLDIEEQKALRETQIEEKRLEVQDKVLGVFAEIARSRGAGPAHPPSPPPPQQPEQPLYRIRCQQCGNEWVTPKREDTVVCPGCSTELRVTYEG